MLEELSATNKIVGIKQLRKALADGRVKKVFIACDADPHADRACAGTVRAAADHGRIRSHHEAAWRCLLYFRRCGSRRHRVKFVSNGIF